MFFKFKQIFFLGVIFTLLFSACSSDTTRVGQETPQERGTEEVLDEQNNQVQAVEAEKETSPIPPTPTLSITQDELLNKWQPPIGAYIFLSASCEATKETVSEYLDSEASDSATLAGEVLGIQIILNLTESAFLEWEAPGDMQSIKLDAQGSIDSIQSMMDRWSDDELATEELANQLLQECEAISTEFENITSTAKGEGLSENNLESILTEIQENFAEEEQAREDESAPSISLEVGRSRSNPFPLGEVGSGPNWDVQVVESIRGEEAWQLIQAANQFNEPAPEGKEYLLVKIHARNTTTEEEERSISDWDFRLTGSHYILYSPASVVEPEPVLEAQLFPNGEFEGWVTFTVGVDEDNLILVLDEAANWDEDRQRFYAVDEGATIFVSEEVQTIRSTDLGTNRSEPVQFSDMVVTQEWEVKVLDVLRGADAWQMIQDANQFNDPPDEGFEYILAKVYVRYIGNTESAASIDKYSFKTTGSGNVLYDAASVVGPEPVLEASVFPGGTSEGWVTLQVSMVETNLIMVFQPWTDWDDTNRRYLSLEN